MTEAKTLTDLAQRVTDIVSKQNYDDAQAVLKWIGEGKFDEIKTGLIKTLSAVQPRYSEKVTIEVTTPTGQVVDVEVNPDTYTTEVVAVLAKQLGLPEGQLRLEYGDQVLFSDETRKPYWRWTQGTKLTLVLIEWSVSYQTLSNAREMRFVWNAEDYKALTNMSEQTSFPSGDNTAYESGEVLINYLTTIADVKRSIAKPLGVAPDKLQLYDDKAVLLTDTERALSHIGLTRGSDNFWYVITD
ncbi:Hypothetical protein POVN_LOCUS126 [uncultured virus]|nr:Hypothetical protein POVN_LOCUS126 [uncultured virus]